MEGGREGCELAPRLIAAPFHSIFIRDKFPKLFSVNSRFSNVLFFFISPAPLFSSLFPQPLQTYKHTHIYSSKLFHVCRRLNFPNQLSEPLPSTRPPIYLCFRKLFELSRKLKTNSINVPVLCIRR